MTGGPKGEEQEDEKVARDRDAMEKRSRALVRAIYAALTGEQPAHGVRVDQQRLEGTPELEIDFGTGVFRLQRPGEANPKVDDPERLLRDLEFEWPKAERVRIDGLGDIDSSEKKPTMDENTKNYIDAHTEKLDAKNEARFAHVDGRFSTIEARFSNLEAKIDVLGQTMPSWRSIWGAAIATVASIIGITFAVLSFAGDRFDGGIAAGSLANEAARQVLAEQAARDERQDEMNDTIFKALENIQRQIGEIKEDVERQ